MSVLSAIGAGVGIAGSIAQPIIDVYNNNRNIHSQERMNEQSMDWQSAESEKSRDWQEKMWLMEQQYNSPAMQKQRLREAGINPFIGDSAINSGSTVAPSASMSGAPNVSAPFASKVDFSSVNRAGESLIQLDKINSDIANQESTTFNNWVESAMQLYKDGKEEAGDKILDLAFAQYGSYAKSKSLTKEYYRNHAELSRIQSETQDFELSLRRKYGDSQANQLLSNMKMEYERISSEKDLNRSMERLHDSELKLVDAKTDSERENAKRIQADAKAALASAAAAYAAAVASKSAARGHNAEAAIKEESKRYLLSKLESEVTIAEMNKRTAKADYESENAWRHAKTTETGQFITVLRNTVSSAAEAIGGVFSGSVSKKLE